jgi:L-rhamnose mutarotase
MSLRFSFIIGFLLIAVIGMASYFALNDADQPSSYENEQKMTVFEPNGRESGALSNIPIVLPIPEKLTFCGEPVPLHRPEILERFEKELYITAHRFYQVVFYMKRGPRIYPELRKLLKEENVPEDLIYLATVESDLIPTIESPVGAKGIWQFMPYTAPSYNLRINKYIDERMHLEKATRAAAEYMKDSKEKFGSWTTAAAAYNMGNARTRRTIKNQRTDNYYDMYLNDETSRYMFRILAAKVIIENPERYGFSFPDDEHYRNEKTKDVLITKGISDIPKWAKKQGFTYYDVRRLNPWIINDQLPRGNYELKIPE